MILEDILFTQGFGTRHDCRALARSGLVEIGGEVRDDPDEDFETDGLVFVVPGRVLALLRKSDSGSSQAAGYECSLKPSAHPSVMTLLPAPCVAAAYSPSDAWTLIRRAFCSLPTTVVFCTGSFIRSAMSPRFTR